MSQYPMAVPGCWWEGDSVIHWVVPVVAPLDADVARYYATSVAIRCATAAGDATGCETAAGAVVFLASPVACECCAVLNFGFDDGPASRSRQMKKSPLYACLRAVLCPS